MHLRGRSSELAAIAGAPDGALIIAGDSGVGKSELLRAIDTLIGAGSGGLVSETYDVSGLDDGLQSAIARGLGDCVRAHHERQPGDLEIWARMADVVRSATTEGARKAGTIIVEAAYGVVADKLGQDTAVVIKAVVSDVLQSAHAGFDARLGGLIATDVAVELNTIAAEIASWCGSRLVVRIDRGEQLSNRDITLLRAIGTLVDPAYLVVVAMSTADSAGADTVGLLQRSGIDVQSIGPLRDEAVTGWLDDAGVDPGKWATIERITNGYPLFLPDAIRLANDGEPLLDIPTSQQFVALQKYAWEQLTEAQRIAAGKLAIFADPPPAEFLCPTSPLTFISSANSHRRCAGPASS
jgi:energy-coupling factor transporter ATP-binding protein EcfA2